MKAIISTLFLVLMLGTAVNGAKCDLESEYGCLRLFGTSGWFQFCPPQSADTKNSDGSNTACTNLRPFRWIESDKNGDSIKQHSLSNFPDLTLASAVAGKMSTTCSASNTYVCGWNADNEGLEYISMRTTANMFSGHLAVTFYLFNESGTVKFGDNSLSVDKGSIKFNIELTDYKFCNTVPGDECTQFNQDRNKEGKHVGFQLELKTPKSSKTTKKVGNFEEIDGIVNFPEFRAQNDSSTAIWTETSPDVFEEGGRTIIQYKFEGPFTDMLYDPIVGAYPSGAAGLSLILSFAVVVLCMAF